MSEAPDTLQLPGGDPAAPPYQFEMHELDAEIPAAAGVYALARVFPAGDGYAFDIETVWHTDDLSDRVEPETPCNKLLVMIEPDADKRLAVCMDIYRTYEPIGDC